MYEMKSKSRESSMQSLLRLVFCSLWTCAIVWVSTAQAQVRHASSRPTCNIRDFDPVYLESDSGMMSQQVMTVALMYHGHAPCTADAFPTVTPVQLQSTLSSSSLKFRAACHRCVSAADSEDRSRVVVRQYDSLDFYIGTRSEPVAESEKASDCKSIAGYRIGAFRRGLSKGMSELSLDIAPDKLGDEQTVLFGSQGTICGGASISAVTLKRQSESFGPEVPLAEGSRMPQGFELHLDSPRTFQMLSPRILLSNRSGSAVPLKSIPCTLSAHIFWEGQSANTSQHCPWSGTFGEDEILADGATIITGDGKEGLQLPKICRWTTVHAEFRVAFQAQKLSFQPFTIPMGEVDCSDSKDAHGAILPPDIKWSIFGNHTGIVLGGLLHTVDGARQADDTPIAHDFERSRYDGIFHVGQTFVFEIYLDNLTDHPAGFERRPNDFAVTAGVFGLNIALDTPVAHRENTDDAEARQTLIIPPHTRQFVRTMRVSDFLKLPVGHYDVSVSPITLTSDVALANIGHEHAAKIGFSIKVVP